MTAGRRLRGGSTASWRIELAWKPDAQESATRLLIRQAELLALRAS
jgi:hypothetical protein